MFPLLALAALAALYYGMADKSGGTIAVKAGELYRITIQVLGAADKQQIEAMYRMAMVPPIAQVGTIIWQGDNMVIQLQYLQDSTITLGPQRAGTGSMNVLKAELLGRQPAPVTMPAAAPAAPPVASATVGALAGRALQTGDPEVILRAALLAKRTNHPILATRLMRIAQRGYRVRA